MLTSKRQYTLGACGLFIAIFMLLNAAAYMHASKMITFTEGGAITKPIERLSFSEKLSLCFTGTNIPKPANSGSPRSINSSFMLITLKTKDEVNLECWSLTNNNPAGNVILLHGYAASKSQLLPEAKFFYDKGYNVLLPDFRASGGSSGNTTSIGYYEALDVQTCYEYIAGKYAPDRPVIIYGISMGGAAALRAVSEFGIKPDKLILESVFSTMLSAVENRFRIAGAPAFPLANLLTAWGGIKLHFNPFHHNPCDYAKKCNTSVLMLQGNADPKVTVEQAKTVFDNLNGKKKIEVFDTSEHASLYAGAPDKWSDTVSRFLTE